jgi:hypothetical protein
LGFFGLAVSGQKLAFERKTHPFRLKCFFSAAQRLNIPAIALDFKIYLARGER